MIGRRNSLAIAIVLISGAVTPPATAAPRYHEELTTTVITENAAADQPRARASADAPACTAEELRQFLALPRPAINVKFWWPKKRSAVDKPRVVRLANELEHVIWPRLSSLMGGGPRMPSDDVLGRQPSCTGDDSALDIYLSDWDGEGHIGADEGVTRLLRSTKSGGPSNIVIHPQSGHDVLAHEVMHVLQNRFPLRRRTTDEWQWMNEAVATWAMSHLYPRSRLYKKLDRLISVSDEPMLGAEGYSAWALLYSLVRTVGPAVIARIYAHGRDAGSLTALDLALRERAPQGRGLRDAWSLFARHAWNRSLKPTALPQSFRQWLAFKAKPEVKPTPLDFGKNPQNVKLKPFGKDYRVYEFADDEKHIRFADPSASETKLDAHAFIKIGGAGWSHEDWTGVEERSFCRSRSGEGVKRVVLVYSTVERGGLSTRDPIVHVKRSCPKPKYARWTASYSSEEHATDRDCLNGHVYLTTMSQTGYHSIASFHLPSPRIEMVGHHKRTTTRMPPAPPLVWTEDYPNDRLEISVVVDAYDNLEFEIAGAGEEGFSAEVPLANLKEALTVPLSYNKQYPCGSTASGTATITLTRAP